MMPRWNSNNSPWQCLWFGRRERDWKNPQKTLASSLREWRCCMTWLQLPQHVPCFWVWYIPLTWLIQRLCASHLKCSKKSSCSLSSTRCLPKFKICLEDFRPHSKDTGMLCNRTDYLLSSLFEQKSAMFWKLNTSRNCTLWTSFGTLFILKPQVIQSLLDNNCDWYFWRMFTDEVVMNIIILGVGLFLFLTFHKVTWFISLVLCGEEIQVKGENYSRKVVGYCSLWTLSQNFLFAFFYLNQQICAVFFEGGWMDLDHNVYYSVLFWCQLN